MQAPEVNVTSDGITGWPEFEQWATHSLPIWNSARYCCARAGMPPTEYLKLVAYHLALENRRLVAAEMKRVEEIGIPLFR